MKTDSESLKKNLFWVLLAVAIPLVLLAMILLGTTVASLIAEEQEKVDKALKDLEGVRGNLKNEGQVKAAEIKAQETKVQETEVWKDAYESQEKLWTWPEKFAEEYPFQTGFFAKKIEAERGSKAPPPGEETPGETPPETPGETPPDMPMDMPMETPSETPGEDEEPAGDAETYENKVRKTANGTIVTASTDWIDVRIDKKKKDEEEEIIRIYRTENVEVTLAVDGEAAKKAIFFNLKAEDKDRDIKGDRVKVAYEIGKYFGDPLTQREIEKFKDTYKDQIHPILKQVEPINTKGEGVVQLGDWLFSNYSFPKANHLFLSYKPNEWLTHPENSKEIWIAQEDLWIQNELYRLVAQANDYVATMDRISGDAKSKKYTYRNPYWDLDLHLDPVRRSLDTTIKNRLSHTQDANVSFKIRFKAKAKDKEGFFIKDKAGKYKYEDTPAVEFELQGGNLITKGTKTLKPSKGVVPAEAEDIAEVKQVLTWENAAIKRIQQVSVGSGKRPGSHVAAEGEGGFAPPFGGGGFPIPGQEGGGIGMASGHSSRTVVKGLKAFFKIKEPEAATAPVEGDDMPPGGAMDGMPAQAGTVSKNGFDYKRYLELTRESRRVPVGVSLVIDQNHLTRVLTSFSNSKLRFLTTQVMVNRYPKNISPLKAGTGQQSQLPGFSMMYGPGAFIPAAPSYPGYPDESGYGMDGMPGGAYQTTDSTSAHIELVIYGVVSLYERFPARPEGAAGNGAEPAG